MCMDLCKKDNLVFNTKIGAKYILCVLAYGESRGQRSLVGCCSWGRAELDTTAAT